MEFDEQCAVDLVRGAGGAQDLLGCYAAPLAREFVAAARAADALENAMTHQRLQHRLEMPRRKAVARRQGFGGDGPASRVERDVDDGGDRQNAFARQERHDRVRGKWCSVVYYCRDHKS